MANKQFKTPSQLIDQMATAISTFSLHGIDDRNKTYLMTYPEFIRYFREIKGDIEQHHVIIGIGFVYSWMPRVLRILKEIDDKVLKIINKVKTSDYITECEIITLMDTFDNSITSVSKLLHFINPEKYGILDSKVFSSIAMKKLSHKKNKASIYISYLELINQITHHELFKGIHEEIQSKLGKIGPVSRIRSAELLFFSITPES